MNSKFEYCPPLLYTDCSKLEFGDFRRLVPPNPGYFNIFKTRRWCRPLRFNSRLTVFARFATRVLIQGAGVLIPTFATCYGRPLGEMLPRW